MSDGGADHASRGGEPAERVTYRDTLVAGGEAALLCRKRARAEASAWRGGRSLCPVEAGMFRQAGMPGLDQETHAPAIDRERRGSFCGRVGGKLKWRASRTRQRFHQCKAFKAELAARLCAVVGATPAQPFASGCSYEHAYGRCL